MSNAKKTKKLLQYCSSNSSNKFLYFKTQNQRDIITQEITPVEIVQMVAKVKLSIVACRNSSEGGQSQAVNSGMYNSSYSHHL